MDPVSVDLLETDFLRGWSVTRLFPLLPFPVRWSRRLAALFLSLRTTGCRLLRGCWCVSAWSIFFPCSLCMGPGLPSLRASVPPLLLPHPCLLYGSSLRCLLLILLSLGRNVGTLPQTSAGHAGASGLAETKLHGLARQCEPAFLAGVDVRTIRSY